MQPVKVGLIGAGFHANTVHVPALDTVDEMQLVAVATSRADTAQAAAQRYRVRGFDDYRALLDEVDLEAVIISTPAGSHAPICRAALEAGKHVFVESPGIPDIGAARELLQLAISRGLVVQVGFLTRYCQAFDVLKQYLDPQPSPRLFTYEYYPYLAHTYNLALYLSGPFERVIGVGGSDVGSAVTVQFQSGDIAVIVGRAVANCSIDLESVRVSTGHFYGVVEARRRVRIFSDMQPTGVDAWNTVNSGGLIYDPQPFAGRFHESTGAAPQLRGFAAAIREGIPPRSTLVDAIATQELLHAIAAHHEQS